MKSIFLLIKIPLLLICSPQIAKSQTRIVTSQNFQQNGWEEEQINKYASGTVRQFSTSYIEIVCGPENNGDLHPGSILMRLPKSQDPTLRRIRLRNNKFDGTYLNKIAAIHSFPGCLQYSTFIIQNRNGSAPDLVIEIDTNDNGTIDYNLAFSPRIQQMYFNQHGGFPFPAVVNDTWQTWNAAAGWWEAGLGETLPAGLGTPFRLADFLQYYPHARLRNSLTGNHAGGGIRFTIGGESDDYDEFIGYLDAFMIFKKTSRTSQETWLNKESPLTPVLYDFKKLQPPCQLINEKPSDNQARLTSKAD